MSLYNLLFGENPMSDQLKEILNLDGEDGKWPTGRFRDIYLSEGGRRIILYTRNGGGNRGCWEEYEDDCDCPGCVIDRILPKHPNYIKDYDDDFDCTYAYIEFSVPEDWLHLTTFLAKYQGEPEDIQEKFEREITRLLKTPKEELMNDSKLAPIVAIVEQIKKVAG